MQINNSPLYICIYIYRYRYNENPLEINKKKIIMNRFAWNEIKILILTYRDYYFFVSSFSRLPS